MIAHEGIVLGGNGKEETKKGIITPCSARQIKEGGSKSSVGREWGIIQSRAVVVVVVMLMAMETILVWAPCVTNGNR